MTDNKQRITVSEAINVYYKLKQQYTANHRNKNIKPLLRSKLSSKERHKAFVKLPNAQCIACKRAVNTIFNVFVNEHGVKNLKASCGDTVNPCSLNIDIMYGPRNLLSVQIQEYRKNIDSTKRDIIRLKNNVMFFQNSDTTNSMQTFTELTDNLSSLSSLLDTTEELNILVNYNPEKYKMLNTLLTELDANHMVPFKKNIAEFHATKNTAFVQEAIRLFVDETKPKLDEIRNLKFKVNRIDFSEADNSYSLIQREHSVQNLEDPYNGDDKINFFVKETVRMKTLKSRPQNPGSKTQKNRPDNVDNDDDDDDDVDTFE